MVPRFCLYLLVAAAISSTILLFALHRTPLDLLQGIGLDHLVTIAKSHGHNAGTVKGPPLILEHPNDTSIANTSASKTILVFATMAETDNSWVEAELSDLISNGLETAFYVTDNKSAPLHTPANKGNEAMAYLTYMIDFYDSLPDVSIFLHAHPDAWHNNFLLGMSSSQMVRHLNHDKVMRDGYMNLRCHWNPGCPTHLNPLATEVDPDKQEEVEIKDAWAAMFPFDKLPEALAQPCCSQFAVTRDRIRNLPRERYVHFRNWLLKSDLSDYISGRIFEYFWQYMLNSSPIFCPDPRTCYCDGYNICFEDVKDYEKYFELATEWQKLETQLRAWKEWKHITERDPDSSQEDDGGFVQIDPKFESIKELAESAKAKNMEPNASGSWDRGDWLNYHIDQLIREMSAFKEQAVAAGRDPARRAVALNAAQESPLEVPAGKLPWWM